MSSEPTRAAAESATARCLLCNVGCPVRVRKAGPDRFLPDYVPHAGYAGLCGRGSVLAELLDHPQRLLAVFCRSGDGAAAPAIEAAAGQMAETLRRAAPAAAVVVDGNFDAGAVAAAGRLAAACGARWSVYVPPADAGLVRGLDPTGCAFVGPEGLAEADAILVVGNAYATHPVAAHWVFEARTRRPRMPVFVLADAAGVTAKFATAAHDPGLAPGDAARAVAAIRTGQAAGLRSGAQVLAGWKEALSKAAHPVIVVGAESGEADAHALAVEVARLAAEVRAAVCPLTAYGASWGALRVAAAGGAVSLESALAGPLAALVAIGVDLESALGRSAASAALDPVVQLIYIGPMPNRTSRRAALVLPAAFPFEGSGQALLGPGRPATFAPLLVPPAGVPTLGRLLAMAGAAAGETPAAVDRPLACGGPAAAVAGGGGGAGILLATAGDPIDFADGSLTRLAAWPRKVRPVPVLFLAASDAEAAGLADKRRAVVEGPGGSAEVEVATSAALRPGQARASAAFAEVRDVFGWKWGGTAPGDPVPVTVRRA